MYLVIVHLYRGGIHAVHHCIRTTGLVMKATRLPIGKYECALAHLEFYFIYQCLLENLLQNNKSDITLSLFLFQLVPANIRNFVISSL